MITAEKLEHRLENLVEQHKVLDKKIESDYRTYMDDIELKQEKIERLRLKSEINELQRQLETLTH